MKKVLTVLATLAFVLVSVKSWTYRSGPGGGLSNAPNEGNCTSCHSGTSLNGGSGSASDITLSGDFTGGGYIPDSTYTLTLKYKQSGISRWGFNLTALNASDDSPAGTFDNLNNRTQKKTRTVSGKTRQYLEQTSTGSSSTGTNEVEWTFEWKAPSSNVGTIKFYACVNAANGNSGTSGDQIYARAIDVVTSSRLPVATASAKDTVVCSGEVVEMIGSGTNSPTQYSWVFQDGSPSVSTDQNPKVSFSGFGKKSAILRVKNAKGWSDADTQVIEILRNPTAFISGGNARTICKGDSLELLAQFSVGNSYLWSNGETGNRITVKDSGSYHVTVTSGSCSRISNTVKVGYFNTPVPTLSSSVTADSICRDEVITLSVNSGFDSVVWYDNAMELATNSSTTYATSVDSGSVFTARGYDGNGCLSDASNTITYKTIKKDIAPEVKCADKEPFSVTFDWTGVATHYGVQVSADEGKSWKTPSSGASGLSHKLTGLDPETDYEVWVRAITDAPCYYSEITKKVCRTGKCNPLDASVTADSAICKGEEVDVVVNGLMGENYSLAFEGGGSFTDTSFSFSPVTSGTYVIEVTDSNNLGCPAKKLSFDVRIDEISDLRFRTDRASNTFCENDSIEFTATSGNDIYRFYVNNNLRATSTDSFYYENQFNDGDSAYVEVEKGACSAKSENIYLIVVPTPNATFTYSNTGSDYDFAPVNENYKSYFWKFGDGFTSVLMKPQHNYKSSENTTVTASLEVTDNSDCVAKSAQDLDIPDFSSVIDLEKAGLSIFPSPAQDKLFVKWDKPIQGETIVKIYTLDGQDVAMFTNESAEFSIDLMNIVKGIYIIEVENHQELVRQRLIKN